MPTPLTPHPKQDPHTPTADSRRSDDELTVALRSRSAEQETRAFAVLLSRHWESVQDYATVCAVSGPAASPMLAAAAFRAVLDPTRDGEPSLALRPRLLLTVRDLARTWALSPEATPLPPRNTMDTINPTDPIRGEPWASGVTVADNRRIAARAFGELPISAQYLLWHTEVEGEPISEPAALLALENAAAQGELEEAREVFRTSCLQAHIELATRPECRYYNRLLDVPVRQGDPLLPDVTEHVQGCEHCRFTVEQLRYFDGNVGALLAESVLVHGADDYLAIRQHRRIPELPGPPPRSVRPPAPPHPLYSARSDEDRDPVSDAPRATGRHRVRTPRVLRSGRQMLAGFGAGAAVLTTAVLATTLWPNGGDDARGSGLPGTSVSRPEASLPPGYVPPAEAAGLPRGPVGGRLRNADAGLCLDVAGQRPRAGASATLMACSEGPSQQWTYEDDGLLRSAADPGLCLDSHADEGVAALGPCTLREETHSADVHYDLTVQGQLIPRWADDLALTPTALVKRADVVVKLRDNSPRQRWLVDPAPSSTRSVPDDPDACGADCRAPAAEAHDGTPVQAPGRASEADDRAPSGPQRPDRSRREL
ncbi:ricin-type beta-trefoil lectin domain protein [Streptomyces uncialis]|uniref:ricin-type beta-trefoil lectin domain protein n=1 Tax=Streptomyces uncialis TaxID=1048205 RepID=UPI00364795FF